MSVNLIEDNRVVYHDGDGDTLEIEEHSSGRLRFNSFYLDAQDEEVLIFVDRDAVETLRDCLTLWLETGKFTLPAAPDSTAMQLLHRHLFPLPDESLHPLPAGTTHYALRRLVDGSAVDLWKIDQADQTEEA